MQTVSIGTRKIALQTHDMSTGILSNVAVSSRLSADLYTDWGSVLYRYRCAHLNQKVLSERRQRKKVFTKEKA
jgi:hypothetical protein